MKTNNNVNLPLQQINLVGMDYSFEGNTVAFDTNGKIMVNATQMARPFNKKTAHWLNLQSTKEFIRELSVLRNINTADLLKVTQGGEPGKQGTWLHEDLAIEFARWLSPRFAIWCNDVIKTIISRKAVETFGFNTENRITITKHYYRNLLVGPLFESKMVNLINKAETMDEKEFLVDIYKAFK